MSVAVLLLVASLFVGLLLVKTFTQWRFCVICSSVTLTWLVLLVLYWLGRFDQPVIIAVLLGQSVVGLYYFLEKRSREDLHVFRLPLLLSLMLAAFAALGVAPDLIYGLGFLAIIWTVLSLLLLYREHPRTRILVDRIVACCRDW